MGAVVQPSYADQQCGTVKLEPGGGYSTEVACQPSGGQPRVQANPPVPTEGAATTLPYCHWLSVVSKSLGWSAGEVWDLELVARALAPIVLDWVCPSSTPPSQGVQLKQWCHIYIYICKSLGR